MSAIFNDFQGRLHYADSILKQVQALSKATKKNLGIVLKNLILNVLYKRKLSMNDISKVTGISEEDLGDILKQMIESKNIKKEGDLYILIEKAK